MIDLIFVSLEKMFVMVDSTKKRAWIIKLGIILMVSSGLFFAAGLIIPASNLNTRTKVITSAVSFVMMEVVFWAGGLLVGKELFVKYKSYFNPRNWGGKTLK